jgi:transcription initiation factor IIF auxiliary subunit
MIGNGCSRAYDIEGHNLDYCTLRSLKLSKLCYHKDDLISKVISRFQLLQQECTQWKIQKSIETRSVILRSDEQKETQQEIYRIQKMRQQLKKDEDDLLLQKQMLHDERRAFEKEKHALETELAKYKGIVENCMKEISSYEF